MKKWSFIRNMSLSSIKILQYCKNAEYFNAVLCIIKKKKFFLAVVIVRSKFCYFEKLECVYSNTI